MPRLPDSPDRGTIESFLRTHWLHGLRSQLLYREVSEQFTLVHVAPPKRWKSKSAVVSAYVIENATGDYKRIPFWYQRAELKRGSIFPLSALEALALAEKLGVAKENPVYTVGDAVKVSVYGLDDNEWRKSFTVGYIAQIGLHGQRVLIEFRDGRPDEWVGHHSIQPLTPLEHLGMANENPKWTSGPPEWRGEGHALLATPYGKYAVFSTLEVWRSSFLPRGEKQWRPVSPPSSPSSSREEAQRAVEQHYQEHFALQALADVANENPKSKKKKRKRKRKKPAPAKRRSVVAEQLTLRRMGTGGSGGHGRKSRKTQRRKTKQTGYAEENPQTTLRWHRGHGWPTISGPAPVMYAIEADREFYGPYYLSVTRRKAPPVSWPNRRGDWGDKVDVGVFDTRLKARDAAAAHFERNFALLLLGRVAEENPKLRTFISGTTGPRFRKVVSNLPKRKGEVTTWVGYTRVPGPFLAGLPLSAMEQLAAVDDPNLKKFDQHLYVAKTSLHPHHWMRAFGKAWKSFNPLSVDWYEVGSAQSFKNLTSEEIATVPDGDVWKKPHKVYVRLGPRGERNPKESPFGSLPAPGRASYSCHGYGFDDLQYIGDGTHRRGPVRIYEGTYYRTGKRHRINVGRVASSDRVEVHSRELSDLELLARAKKAKKNSKFYQSSRKPWWTRIDEYKAELADLPPPERRSWREEKRAETLSRNIHMAQEKIDELARAGHRKVVRQLLPLLTCPKCLAGRNRECVTPSGRPAGWHSTTDSHFHLERLEEAERTSRNDLAVLGLLGEIPEQGY